MPVESAADKVEEIETLNGLLGDLERKASISKHMAVASLFVILCAFHPLIYFDSSLKICSCLPQILQNLYFQI